MELKPILFPSTAYINANSTTVEGPSGQELQESHPNWEAPRIDHLEMPPSTVQFLVHQQHQDVAQDLQDNAEVHRVQPEHQVLGEIPQENAPVDQQQTAEERR